MLYDKRISLDPRLSMIAAMVGSCESCADIGSDHGRLGAFLLQNRQCREIALTDISAPSLDKARRLIALLGLSDQVKFGVGDGARALDVPPEVAVIAGMGGETIAEILQGAGGMLEGARLILQPNVAAPQLRSCLNALGLRICREELVRDGRRIYLIIEAVPGEQALSETEAEVGPVLLAQKPPLLKDYAAFRLRVAKKALSGARNGSDTENVAALQREIEIWEDVDKCL